MTITKVTGCLRSKVNQWFSDCILGQKATSLHLKIETPVVSFGREPSLQYYIFGYKLVITWKWSCVKTAILGKRCVLTNSGHGSVTFLLGGPNFTWSTERKVSRGISTSFFPYTAFIPKQPNCTLFWYKKYQLYNIHQFSRSLDPTPGSWGHFKQDASPQDTLNFRNSL